MASDQENESRCEGRLCLRSRASSEFQNRGSTSFKILDTCQYFGYPDNAEEDRRNDFSDDESLHDYTSSKSVIRLFRDAKNLDQFNSFFNQDYSMKRILSLLQRAYIINDYNTTGQSNEKKYNSSSLIGYSLYMTIENISIKIDSSPHSNIINCYFRNCGSYHNPYGPAVIELIEYCDSCNNNNNDNNDTLQIKYKMEKWLHGKLIRSYIVAFDGDFSVL